MHSLRKLAFVLFAILLMVMPLAVLAQTATPAPAETEEAAATEDAPATEEAVATEEAAATAEASQPASVAIEVGETVEDELTEASPSLNYTLEGEEGTSIVITLISEDFDPYLSLLDEDGEEIAFDDDSAGNLDSRIGPFVLPADGEYTIVALSYPFRNGSGVGTGEFTLTVESFEVETIEYGETVEGTLTETMLEAPFYFRGSEGDTVLISLSSDDFDSFLTLTDPEGFELITNDDGGGNLNSLIGPFTLPETGDYLISASSLGGTSVGDFVLSLERAELVTLEYGDTATVDFDDDNTIAYFTFEGSTGDVVDITVDGDVDTNLTLNDIYNYRIGYDEDSGSGNNPELMGVLLNQSGTYTILLQAPFGGEGSAELTLTRGVIPSLNDGPQTLNFTSAQNTRTVVYEGEAGETIRLNVVVEGGDVASPTVDVSQDGISLAYFNASTVEGLSGIFTIPEDGEIIVIVSEYSGSNISLEISVSSAE